MTPKYLIFDFDGVLGNTYDAVVHGKATLENKTKEQVKLDLVTYFNKSSHTRDLNLSAQALQEVRRWTVACGELVCEHGYELFEEFIEEIKNIPNTKLAVVSSGTHIYIKPKLAATGLPFTHILTIEDHHSKEEKIEMICRDWNISVQDAYYFTDTISDVLELENIMDRNKLYGCAWGYHGYDRLATVLDDDHIFKNYSDIQRIITHS